ncbi:MAG: MFS transporter [Rhodospirillales bacterium]|nr:MFS transporter [Rhodospirillales bacterium]
MLDNKQDEFVPWRELLGSGYGVSLMFVCMGVWLHAADSLIVATMLPSIIDEIGGVAFVSWTVSLYQIGSIIAGAMSAFLSMRLGLRRPMAGAALMFGLGCLVSAIAPEMWILLIGRLLQGFGGGGMVAMSFVAVSVIFPKRLIARAMAAVSTLWGVSAFLGPLIGGFFVEFANWRIGFWFFAAQAVLFSCWILLAAKMNEKPTDGVTRKPPFVRLGILSTGVVLIAYAGIDITPLRSTLLIIAGLSCLLLFLHFDAKHDETRLLPFRPFDVRWPVGAALSMILAFSIATIAISTYGPILIIFIHGVSALSAGYIIACSSIGWSVVAVLVSGSPKKHDGKLIACGMLILTISIIGFYFSVPSGPIWLIAAFSLMEGAGFGMAWTFILRRTATLAPPHEMQRISAALPTVQRLGYALGAAYVGIVANAVGFEEITSSAEFAHASKMIFLSCLPFAAIGLIAMTRLVRQF